MFQVGLEREDLELLLYGLGCLDTESIMDEEQEERAKKLEKMIEDLLNAP